MNTMQYYPKHANKLPFLELEDAGAINEGDELQIDLAKGTIKNLTQHKAHSTHAFPSFLQEIVQKGGLMRWIKAKKESRR